MCADENNDKSESSLLPPSTLFTVFLIAEKLLSLCL